MSSNLKSMILPLATDQSPNLLEFIAQQQKQIVQLQEWEAQLLARIEVLESEIIRLKKLNPKPNIKPNTKPPDDSDSNGSSPSPEESSNAEEPEDDNPHSLNRK